MLTEKVGSNTTKRHVWSPAYVDALVLRDRDTNADGTMDERLWVQQDANFNVTALVNSSGAVVERYVYDPYGVQSVYNASWSSIGSSAYSWSAGFQGMFFDTTAGLSHQRERWYSPALGVWINLDPIRFEGRDIDLYRFVGNNPGGATDSSGLRADDPEPFELLSGVFRAIRDKTLKPIDGLHGKTFDSKDNIAGTNAKLSFKFDKAYIGSYYWLAGEKDIAGLYVKISVNIPKNICECKEITFIQVTRSITVGKTGIETSDPQAPWRQLRSGWNDPNAPSIGWRVDTISSSKDPNFGTSEHSATHGGNTGAQAVPAVMHDAPGTDQKNDGAEFITAAICRNEGKGKILGYVRWGYYVGLDGKPHLLMPGTLPFVSTGITNEWLDAVKRWNGIKGNLNANIE